MENEYFKTLLLTHRYIINKGATSPEMMWTKNHNKCITDDKMVVLEMED